MSVRVEFPMPGVSAAERRARRHGRFRFDEQFA
jgi:hypothetical protein